MAEILIIEDDLRLRTEIEKYLVKKGHDVTSTHDGQEGFDYLRSLTFDVAVIDIRIPGLSGTELLRKMSESLPCHPPIIIITGHGDKGTAIKAIHYGAFDFIEKPFDPTVLENTIHRALVERKQDILNFKAFISSSGNMELSPREREVAHLAADGFSNEEIARKLSMGSETVKSHLKHIFKKLVVPNRTVLSAKLRR